MRIASRGRKWSEPKIWAFFGHLQVLDRLAGVPPVLAPLPPETLVALAQTRAPDAGLRRLEWFVDSSAIRNSLYACFTEDPLLLQYLVRVLSHSNFLTDILVRNPEYLYWFFEETPFLVDPLDKKTLQQILHQEIHESALRQDRLDVLRRIQRRELLRIGAAEILALKEVA